MSNRYNSDNPNGKIRNTDNEQTQYFSQGSYYGNTAELRPSDYNSASRSSSQSGSDYYGSSPSSPNVSQTPGRMEYYGSDDYNGNNRRPPQRQSSSGQPVRRPSATHSNQSSGSGQRPVRPRQPQQGARQGQPSSAAPRQGQRPAQPRQRSGQPQQKNVRRPVSPENAQRVRRPSAEYGAAPAAQQTRRKAAPPQPQKNKPEKKRKRRKNIFSRIFTSLLVFVIVIFGIYSLISVSLIKKLNHVETENRSHVAGAMDESYVRNILLIGTDGRTLDERGRSDTMIMLSLNSKTDKLFLTSFMRDSYVEIPGHGHNKLNAAYSFGGAELLMDTIELNFNVRIEDYISVNFNSFASIVDSVGGIEIDVTDAEAKEINTILMAEVNELMGDAVDSDLLSQGGKIILSGKQALSYARIRHIGNADFERTERQRDVITKIVEKLKTFKPSYITDIAKNAIPQITTNMSTGELYLLSLRLPFVIGYDIEQLRIPAEGYYGNTTTSDGGSALSVDFTPNINIIRENVFAEN